MLISEGLGAADVHRLHVWPHEDALADVAAAVAAADYRVGAGTQGQLLLVKRAEHANGRQSNPRCVVRLERDLDRRAVGADQLADLDNLRSQGLAAGLEALGPGQDLFRLIEELRRGQLVGAFDDVAEGRARPVLLGDPAGGQDGMPFPFLMQAMNLGARYGVIGEYLETADDPDSFDNLANMTVISANPDGTERSMFQVAVTDSVHPVLVTLQVAEALKKRGEALEVGDVISVGAMMEEFIDVAVPIEGKRHVHYYIGDRVISVSAGFRE